MRGHSEKGSRGDAERRSRREFVAGSLGLVAMIFGASRVIAQEPMKKWPVDPLRDPASIGQKRDVLHPLDNDPVLIAIERKLRCTCGCTLDIYTCRTTDFSCTYSPELHRQIRDQFEAGKTPEQIIDLFVAREGTKALMSPPRSGFNLAGYLVPGLSVATAALLLAAYLSRKRAAVPAVARSTTQPVAPDAEQMERLRKALDEVES